MALAVVCGLGVPPRTQAQGVPPRVENLSVSQIPGTFLVEIRYDLVDPDSDYVRVTPEFSADGGATYNLPARDLTGDFVVVTPGRGKVITWNAWNDWANQFTTRGRVRLIVDDTKNAVFPPPFPAPLTGLVWIPPGTFTMGSPSDEVDRYPNEGPQTQVYLSRGFFMGNAAVTQAEYQEVVGSNPSSFQGNVTRPVETVSWNDAVYYCERLTSRERMAGRLPVGWVYRLPTEAEWEYACRAGTTTRFSHGVDLGYALLGNYAWFVSNSLNTTHPVRTRAPNAWGLYDMHGNVRGWCADWWSDQLPGGSVTDPKGPITGWSRVLRGGSWDLGGRFCRSAYRIGYDSNGRDHRVGFRVVLAPGQP